MLCKYELMNTLGELFRVTSFGESHGEWVGCVIDGCPAGMTLDMGFIQSELYRRKAKQANYSTARIEDDTVKIISGVYEGITTGAPIAILIENKNANSSDYNDLKNVLRPGHADATMQMKYGIRDHRGGGRTSIRITAPIVAAGAIAQLYLKSQCDYQISSYVSSIGDIEAKKGCYSKEQILQSEIACPDGEAELRMLALIDEIKAIGDTLGGQIVSVVHGIPPGIGEPLFGKIQSKVAAALMSINTVKSISFGEGKGASALRGSEHNDTILSMTQSGLQTKSNTAGGILGGISTGEAILVETSFKPISSIATNQQSVDINNEPIEFAVRGRHDVCAVPRAVAIVDAYISLVMADLVLLQKGNRI